MADAPQRPRPRLQIFVSYRRNDTGGHAGRLHDNLLARFGKYQVFMDIDSIRPGSDFTEALGTALDKCDVLLALMGRTWLATRSRNGRRRLDDPNDFVRRELEAALQRDVPIIPLLLDGAGMPTAAQLPDSLKAIATRQALELSDRRWRTDADALTKELDRLLNNKIDRVARRRAGSTPRAGAGGRATTAPEQGARPPGAPGPMPRQRGSARSTPAELVVFTNGRMTFGETVSRVADSLSPFGAAARVIAEAAACRAEHRRLTVAGRHIDAQHEYNLTALRSRGATVRDILSITRVELDTSDKQARARQRALENIRRELARATGAHQEYLLEVYRMASAELASQTAAQGDALSRRFDDILNGPGALAVAPKPLPNLPTSGGANRSSNPAGARKQGHKSTNHRPSGR